MADLVFMGCRDNSSAMTTVWINTIIIGTFCIAHDHSLLHDDQDFAPMEKHLGLRVV